MVECPTESLLLYMQVQVIVMVVRRAVVKGHKAVEDIYVIMFFNKFMYLVFDLMYLCCTFPNVEFSNKGIFLIYE